MSKAKTKNPCIVCCKQVKPKYGIQCRGACKKWAHYDCLNFCPEKIKDIKKGCVEITCPCPGCEASRQKDAKEKHVNEPCSENLSEECPGNPKVKSEPGKQNCPLCSRIKKGSDCSLCGKIQAALPECPADLKCELKSAPKAKTCDAPCSPEGQKLGKRQKLPKASRSPKDSLKPPCSPKGSPKPPCSPKGSTKPPCLPEGSSKAPCSPKGAPKPPCSPKGSPKNPCSPKGSPKPPCSPKGSPKPPCLPKEPPRSPKAQKLKISTKAQRSPNNSKALKCPQTDCGDDLGPSCCSFSCPSFDTELKSQQALPQCPSQLQNSEEFTKDKDRPCPPLQSVSWSGLVGLKISNQISNQNLKHALQKLVCTVKDLTSHVKSLMCEIKNLEQHKAE